MASFDRQMSPHGKTATLTALLKKDGYAFSFTAPTAGQLVVSWYLVPGGVRISNVKPSAETKSVLVATGRLRVARGSTDTIKVKLTAAGEKLLKRSTSLKLAARGKFTPNAQTAIVATTTFTLKK
jgi:hypothetical protein